MACGACAGARQQFVGAVRRASPIGVGQAVYRAAAINLDKMKGVDVDRKYGTSTTPGTIKARPYKRPERT